MTKLMRPLMGICALGAVALGSAACSNNSTDASKVCQIKYDQPALYDAADATGNELVRIGIEQHYSIDKIEAMKVRQWYRKIGLDQTEATKTPEVVPEGGTNDPATFEALMSMDNYVQLIKRYAMYNTDADYQFIRQQSAALGVSEAKFAYGMYFVMSYMPVDGEFAYDIVEHPTAALVNASAELGTLYAQQQIDLLQNCYDQGKRTPGNTHDQLPALIAAKQKVVDAMKS